MTPRMSLQLALLPFLPLLAIPAGAAMPNNSVSGAVTFQGTPLAGVTITAYNTNTNSITQVATTGENGDYSLQLPAWINPQRTASADYDLWASKAGYGFYPSVASGASITRSDHTGNFAGNGATDVAIYFTVIHYVALPDPRDQGRPGPPLTGANFNAYDGSNPLLNLAAADVPLEGTARFLDGEDGTLTDRTTGLVWLKQASCFGPATWESAVAQVNALASGACGLADGSAAGDWRLPNMNELESVLEAARARENPFLNVSKAIYWSSTSYFGGKSGSPNAWAIRVWDGRYFNDGATNNKATALNEVWAVKSSPTDAARLQSTGQYVSFVAGDDGSRQRGVPPAFPRFVDKGDGTVADTVTGLVWLKQADCIRQTWAEAIASVAALAGGQCGLTDESKAGNWRMPSRKEMLSLSDRMENNHAAYFSHTYLTRDGALFQPAIFTDFLSYQYDWTSTAHPTDSTRVWTVFSCDFGVYDTLNDDVGYTLAVR